MAGKRKPRVKVPVPVDPVQAKARAFLAAYRTCASVTQAAAAAGITRHTHYNWLDSCPAYVTAFEKAQIEAASVLEDEAVERATKGVYEPNVWQGGFVYPQIWDEEKKCLVDEPGSQPLGVYKKSDGLLQFLLRGLMPHKYAAKSAVELTGKDGGPIDNAITVTFVTAKGDDKQPE